MALSHAPPGEGLRPERRHHEFCTLFDLNYAARGLVLYRSLERQCGQDFTLTILCIDDLTYRTVGRLGLDRARLVRVEDLEDAGLNGVRRNRGRREFCWTCPSALMLWLLNRTADGGIVSYLDADMEFFGDPQPIYDELGTGEILIHGHRFPPRYRYWQEVSGLYNVGLVAARSTPQGLACMTRWRAQCIESCAFDPARKQGGDQKYLDDWPASYDRLVVLEHVGAGLAPWNAENYAVVLADGGITVDGRPLIFYHYHALVVLSRNLFGWFAVVPCRFFPSSRVVRNAIYRPYVRRLRKAQAEIDGVSVQGAHEWDIGPVLADWQALLRRREIIIA
jgi:hypothetical protein